MFRFDDWVRGLPEFLRFLGWLGLGCGALLLALQATGSSREGYVGVVGGLVALLGAGSLLLGAALRALRRRAGRPAKSGRAA